MGQELCSRYFVVLESLLTSMLIALVSQARTHWSITCAGANMAPKLAQLVSVNGLANSYMAFNTNYQDTGLFGVYAVSEKSADHEDMCWSIMHEITKMCYDVSEDDVARARNQLKSSILFSQDGTSGVSGMLVVVLGLSICTASPLVSSTTLSVSATDLLHARSCRGHRAQFAGVWSSYAQGRAVCAD